MGKIKLLLGASILLLVSSANASVYHVDRNFATGNNISGYIETDGTIGVLSIENIVDWAFDISLPSTTPGYIGEFLSDACGDPLGEPLSCSIDAASGHASVIGSALTASTQQLLFDFSTGLDSWDGTYLRTDSFSFGGPLDTGGFVWCIGIFTCDGGSNAEELRYLGGDFGAGLTWYGAEEVISFASISPVPIPAAGWLFGTALIGLVGFSKRRKAA